MTKAIPQRTMEQQLIDVELEDARDLLETTSAAHLAYNAQDGTPRVVPVGFFWTGREFVISTAATAPKVEALSRHPDVALSVDAGGSPDEARALSIRGRAKVTLVNGVVEEYLEAARQNMSTEDAEAFERNCRRMYDRMARIAITPTWARYYDFATGRMPCFLNELAQRAAAAGRS